MSRPPNSQRTERLYVLYAAAAFRLARRILGSSERAEDAVQEAFTRAHGYYNASTPETERAWLMGTVVKVALQVIRSEGLHKKILDSTGSQIAPTLHRTPLDGERRAYATQLLDIAVTHLSPGEFKLFVCLFEELPIAELAESLGIKPDTLAKRVLRLKRRLNDLLGGNGDLAARLQFSDDSNVVDKQRSAT